MSSVIVFGGYGVFGRIVCRELAKHGVRVTVAGRNRAKVDLLAEHLGNGHRGVVADVTDERACEIAIADHDVAVNCAGPFAELNSSLLDACLTRGCHYVDITDDRSYAAYARGLDKSFRKRTTCAVIGCSSLPSISGALALLVLERKSSHVERARVSLVVGNDLPKGRAATAAAVAMLGKRIDAPQGALVGFRGREVIGLPEPFGRRACYTVESPEYDLFPELLRADSVSVKAAFEMRAATFGLATLALLSSSWGTRTADLLWRVGRRIPRVGSSGAAVMTELSFSDGTTQRAALVAAKDGQRMAALPAVLAAMALADGDVRDGGVLYAFELLGSRMMLERIAEDGFELVRS